MSSTARANPAADLNRGRQNLPPTFCLGLLSRRRSVNGE
jgi:hypothetical protein